MNFLEADVAIKVDDSRLPAQLAKARSLVTRFVAKVKVSFSKMAASFKAAWDKMIRYAKYGALIIAGVLIYATRAAMKQEEAYAKLATVLKSTGYAAGLSAKELIAHAEALQKVTVYGDETIQGMQALLLTFKGIKEEVFMRTTEVILDLSKAMSQDLQQSAIQVGKAINDPILGMTALARVGIQFTESQKEQIKTLVKSNRLFEAQAIILTELESEFGGMSRIVDTGLGKWAQMQNVLGDVAETIGNALLPGVKDSLTAIKEWAEKNTERIGRWAEISVAYIVYVKDVLVSFIMFLKIDWKAGLQFAMDVGIIIWEKFAEKMKTLFRELGEDLGNIITGEWPKSIWDWTKEKVIPPPAGIYQKPTPPPGAPPKLIFKGYGEPEPTTIFAEPVVTEIDKVTKALDSIVPPDLKVKFDAAGEKLKASLQEIETAAEHTGMSLVEMAEQWMAVTEESFETIAETTTEVAEKTVKVTTDALDEMKQKAFQYSNTFRNTLEYGLEQSMRDYTNWKEHVLNMFQEIYWGAIRVAFIRPMAEAFGGVLRAGAMSLFGGGGAGPGQAGRFSAGAGTMYQEGGYVQRGGLARLHTGETVTPASKPSPIGGRTLDVRIHNEGSEKLEISSAEEYMLGDQRIIDVTMQAMGHNMQLQGAVKSAVRS